MIVEIVCDDVLAEPHWGRNVPARRLGEFELPLVVIKVPVEHIQAQNFATDRVQ